MRHPIFARSLRAAALLCCGLLCLSSVGVQGVPVQPRLGARSDSIADRYGIKVGLSSCLESKQIDFVDARRNDSHVYFEASQGDNLRFHFHPLAIVYPRSTQQVSDAVVCAARNGNVQTVARSGGHAFSGFSSGGQDGAMIVDFRRMTSIVSDSKNALVHIEPGARLGDVVKTLWADGKRGMPHGTCPTVGVGGHTLCGGVGPLSRKWGMATDNMIEAEVVMADGSVVHASQHANSDLWWALRGAGVFYGLATRFTFATYSADFPTTYIRYKWSPSIKSVDDAVKIMQAIQAFGTDPQLPSEIGFHVQVRPISHGSPEEVMSMQLKGMYLGSRDAYIRDVIPPLWKELSKRGLPGKADMVDEEEMNYLDLMKMWDDFGAPDDKLNTQAERKIHNNFVTRTSMSMGQQGFSTGGFRTIFDALWQQQMDERAGKVASHDVPSKDDHGGEHTFWLWNLFFELFGGANNRMRDPGLISHSAMAHRDGLWLMQASVGSVEDKPLVHNAYAMVHRMNTAVHTAMQDDKIPRMSYSCYTDSTLDDWAHLYYGDSVPRMTELKKRYDPTNLFRSPQSLIETPRSPSIASDPDPWLNSPHPLP